MFLHTLHCSSYFLFFGDLVRGAKADESVRDADVGDHRSPVTGRFIWFFSAMAFVTFLYTAVVTGIVSSSLSSPMQQFGVPFSMMWRRVEFHAASGEERTSGAFFCVNELLFDSSEGLMRFSAGLHFAWGILVAAWLPSIIILAEQQLLRAFSATSNPSHRCDGLEVAAEAINMFFIEQENTVVADEKKSMHSFDGHSTTIQTTGQWLGVRSTAGRICGVVMSVRNSLAQAVRSAKEFVADLSSAWCCDDAAVRFRPTMDACAKGTKNTDSAGQLRTVVSPSPGLYAYIRWKVAAFRTSSALGSFCRALIRLSILSGVILSASAMIAGSSAARLDFWSLGQYFRARSESDLAPTIEADWNSLRRVFLVLTAGSGLLLGFVVFAVPSAILWRLARLEQQEEEAREALSRVWKEQPSSPPTLWEAHLGARTESPVSAGANRYPPGSHYGAIMSSLSSLPSGSAPARDVGLPSTPCVSLGRSCLILAGVSACGLPVGILAMIGGALAVYHLQ
jgi:hypothetical protein